MWESSCTLLKGINDIYTNSLIEANHPAEEMHVTNTNVAIVPQNMQSLSLDKGAADRLL